MELKKEIQNLEKYISSNDLPHILIILKNLVEGFKPEGKIVDYIFNENLKNDPIN